MLEYLILYTLLSLAVVAGGVACHSIGILDTVRYRRWAGLTWRDDVEYKRRKSNRWIGDELLEIVRGL